MATRTVVTGDRYFAIDGKLLEIKRQLRQKDGYPFDPDRLERVLQDAVEGRFNVSVVFDLDAAPYCPEGWTVESHKPGGSFVWDPSKVRLHFEPEHSFGWRIDGFEFLKRSVSVPAFNANLLDGLLGRPELIPDEWKGMNIFFPNTVYRIGGGSPCIRFLGYNGEVWGQGEGWVAPGCDTFDEFSTVLVRVST